MKIQSIPIAVLVGALVTIIVVGFVDSLSDEYAPDVPLDGLNRTIGASQNLTNASQDLYDDVINFIPKEGETAFNIPYNMLTLGWNLGRTMIRSIILLDNMLADGFNMVSGTLGLPIQIQSTLMAAIVMVLVAIIIFAVFKWKWED